MVEGASDDDQRRAIKEVTLKARSVSRGGGASRRSGTVGHALLPDTFKEEKKNDAREARVLWSERRASEDEVVAAVLVRRGMRAMRREL